MLLGSDEVCEPDQSPIAEDEVRIDCSLEAKYVTGQSWRSILKVNLRPTCSYLLTVKLFIKKLENLPRQEGAIEEVKQLQILTSYGISFGLGIPVTILKLLLNFGNRPSLGYELRFLGSPSKPPGLQLDWAIDYIIHRMKKGSPPLMSNVFVLCSLF